MLLYTGAMQVRAIGIMVAACGVLAVVAGAGDDPPGRVEGNEAARVRYDRDIRPLLSDRCFQCHGTDAAARQANLRLDDSVSATEVRKSGAAIVPGDLAASQVWKRIRSHDAAEKMPPPTSTKRAFNEREIALIGKWIEEGAVYEPHWSFVPPVNGAVPAVRDGAWARHDLDRHVQAGLEAKGLSPSAEADKATLLRRVYLDVTGLPPTAEELREFVADTATNAYERRVERLLTQEPFVTRYGERMATPWLDAARYADTSGIHHDQGRAIWPYRDWVIEAFRSGMAFDRFVVEQLAGDLLSRATQEQTVATGFNRCHVTSDEGGAIEEEYLFEYAVDRTATTGGVLLGLTMGCARCHDHKFDPVTQAEFYGLLAFFNSIEEKGIDTRLDDANVAYPPSITLSSPETEARIAGLNAALKHIREKGEAIRQDPAQAAGAKAFVDSLAAEGGVRWFETSVVTAASRGGATMTVQPDGSVLASGTNPGIDTHTFMVRAESGARLLLLEALRDPTANNKVGRAGNGNVVVTGLRVEAVSRRDSTKVVEMPLQWVWANIEQTNENFLAANLLTGNPMGWAVAGHEQGGDRVAMFVLAPVEGFEGGTDYRVTVMAESQYAHHVFARTRVTLGTATDAGLATLPAMSTAWFTAGPFAADTGKPVFDQAFGPEAATGIDLKATFEQGRMWRYEPRIVDGGSLAGLSNVVGAVYVARTVFAPTPRRVEVSLGTDDGVRVLAGGREVHVNRIERSLKPDSDRFAFDVHAGATTVVYKVVNTGGPDGFAHREVPTEGVLPRGLVAAVLPERSRGEDFVQAYIREHSPEYRATIAEEAALNGQVQAAEAGRPKSMVMKELATPRATFVMDRGQYDHPITTRPVTRGVPAFLGAMPESPTRNRLDLANWMVREQNPLTARVIVNRVWEMFFGQGIVRTTEDFGLQGEYPSHPELLDHLAVTFRESGWDMKALVRMIVTSATYRQASRVRPEAVAVDPENRLLAYFPRRRLPGEVIRDQALYTAGLLVEKAGGPSVRPYQPPGLWEEVSMPDSNTGKFVRGNGEDLWRRSLYTFWKRAAPSPSMLTFDVPTRESCVIRRQSTNTPLQALVLWNDEQFVEAARGLAVRAMRAATDDDARLVFMYVTATGREPGVAERSAMVAALGDFRARFTATPKDADDLLAVGEANVPMDLSKADLAAWTMIANAVLASDAAIVQR